jgi:hypothetical protein
MAGDFSDKGKFHANEGFFNMPQICDMNRRLYFPSEGRHAEDFFALKNQMVSAGFEPANLGTRGQHTNHETTEAACLFLEYAVCCVYSGFCEGLITRTEVPDRVCVV